MRKKVWGAMVMMGSRTWELGNRSWIGGERPALLRGPGWMQMKGGLSLDTLFP